MLSLRVKVAAFILTLVAVSPLVQGFAGESKRLPIYSVDRPEKVLALTFNAAWDDADTEKILDILKNENIKASFFLCGSFINKHSGIVRQIHELGHDVCNHGNTHAHVASLNLEKNLKEIEDAHIKIKDLLGIDMWLYRGPFGEYNNTVIQAAEQLGYTMIQWNVDSMDWMNKGAEDMLTRVTKHKNLQNGSIILFHTDAKHTAEILPRIIAALREEGYGFMPVTELIIKDEDGVPSTKVDHAGRQGR
ncbi:MAG: polysaccharide deacetylase family protein [Defluviitaleaceae bacterium]|nr:polysaccharide deacetylase family protein [Defluviitaleaceae bacterium]